MSGLDLKSFDSASTLIDSCLEAMRGMTEDQRAELRTEILREFGLPTMRAISTVHLVERQHADRFRQVFGNEGGQRVLDKLRGEALAAIIRARVAEAHETDATPRPRHVAHGTCGKCGGGITYWVHDDSYGNVLDAQWSHVLHSADGHDAELGGPA